MGSISHVQVAELAKENEKAEKKCKMLEESKEELAHEVDILTNVQVMRFFGWLEVRIRIVAGPRLCV